ncbi:unnamed protein product [Lymnaea stagnalis]|uniref:Hexosyltransferase n=1 Tax=Lymnaea stagnalis TaxID=6523 RepID=A0AAV2H2D1_LYMST
MKIYKKMYIKEVVCCAVAIFLTYIHVSFKETVDLAICILSARNNFEHRSAIRKSWLKDMHTIRSTQNKNMVAKFVVGKVACSVHPENRIDHYDCERWTPSIPDKPVLQAFSLKSASSPHMYKVAQKFYVKVMHDITLLRLGVAEFFILPFLQANASSHVDIVVYDVISNEEIAHAHIITSLNVHRVDGYLYRPIQEMHLPKGYEFEVELRLPEDATFPDHLQTLPSQRVMNWDVTDSHNEIVILKPLNEDGTLMLSKHVPSLSFMFSTLDTDGLRQHLELSSERDLAWQKKTNLETIHLQEEQLLHQDMIMMDVTDVYRSLPEKILLCHDWFRNNYDASFILKTDDDCFINLENIISSLVDLDVKTLRWWGNFRIHWLVEQHGKWRELDYSNTVYPRFACGSGNIVSKGINEWLVKNKNMLKRFQGEDVSMGIWLSGLNIDHVQDDRWQCGMSCHRNVYSVPELTPEKVMLYWNNSKTCSNPCQNC